MEELIWFFVFMIGVVLAVGIVVWYLDWREEKKKSIAS